MCHVSARLRVRSRLSKHRWFTRSHRETLLPLVARACDCPALPPFARFLSWVRPRGVLNGLHFPLSNAETPGRISRKRLSRLAWTMLPPWRTTLGHHWLNCGRGDSAWNLWERDTQWYWRPGYRRGYEWGRELRRIYWWLYCYHVYFVFFLSSSSLASPCLPSLSPRTPLASSLFESRPLVTQSWCRQVLRSPHKQPNAAAQGNG